MLKVLSGNKAAVYGAKLARVEVAAVYPITPQSQISEDITKVVAAQRGVSTSRQDVMTVRDCGWLELDPASPQEVLDSVLMAYRLAEDPEILLPVMVDSDGFYMSHAYEPVDVPTQEQVDQFLEPVSGCNRTTFQDGRAMQFDVGYSGVNFINQVPLPDTEGN